MKLLRKVLSATAAILILFACVPAAYAEGTDDARFEGKTWEQVVDEFLYEYGVDTYNVALGYCNLATGEEHYYNGDKFMIAASLYKVPLNMYYNDLIYNGEMDFDTVIGYETTYDYLLEETIVYSNNETAGTLMQNMGGYQAMRRMFCDYMDLDADTVDPAFLTNDYFTPRQMITCLRKLYDGSERYSKIIDYMKQAEPNNYFKFNTQQFEVAHKYGFDRVDFHEYLNDCAIVYTDEPIAIVMFSDTLNGGYNTMSSFCTLMSDYAQYATAARIAAAAQEKVDLNTAEREAVAATTPEPIVIQKDEEVGFTFGTAIAVVLSLAAAAAALVLVLRAGKAGKINTIWAVVAVIAALIALLLCAVGSAVGTVVAKPKGDPQQTVTTFFDALDAGDYESAYGCLQNCNSLGLEKSPTTDTGIMVYDALKESYSYELYGECITDKLTAYQQLRFDSLDLTAFESDVQEATMTELRKLVQTKSRSEIYDANDQYLPSITAEAYKNAVTGVLKTAEAYYTTTWLTVELTYSDGQWLIITDPAMLKAIVGGVTY